MVFRAFLSEFHVNNFGMIKDIGLSRQKTVETDIVYLIPMEKKSILTTIRVSKGNMADKKCPDCQGNLGEIKLIGEGWENPLSGVQIQTELVSFTEPDAPRGTFSGKFKSVGSVQSYICQECGRIFQYGTFSKKA
jgi:hypothetical protein